MNLMIGGNAVNFGLRELSSLESFLFQEDVANLAMMAYEESIRRYSFFSDPEIIDLYFNDTSREFTIFGKMFHI